MSERHTGEFEVEFSIKASVEPVIRYGMTETWRIDADKRLDAMLVDAVRDGRRYVVQVLPWQEEPVEGGTRYSRTAVVLLVWSFQAKVGEFSVRDNLRHHHDCPYIDDDRQWERRTLAGGFGAWERVK